MIVRSALVFGLGLAALASVGRPHDAVAGPRARRILVLRIDGNADATVRAMLENALAELARTLVAKVAVGDTTFAETASAVGCEPSAPACASLVLSTLAVDEIVYGTATTTPSGKTTIVMHHAVKPAATSERTAVIGPGDGADAVIAQLGPEFGRAAAAKPSPSPSPTPNPSPSPTLTPSPSPTPSPTPPPTEIDAATTNDDHRDRDLGIGLAIGGGVTLAVGFTLWASESNLQASIDNHAIVTQADIQDLKRLEDKASRDATLGNVLVGIGIAAGAAGGYFLWRTHGHHTTVAPVVGPTAAGVVIGGRW